MLQADKVPPLALLVAAASIGVVVVGMNDWLARGGNASSYVGGVASPFSSIGAHS